MYSRAQKALLMQLLKTLLELQDKHSGLLLYIVYTLVSAGYLNFENAYNT